VVLQGEGRRRYMHGCSWLFISRIKNIKRKKQEAFLGAANAV
jgi:hypothetical protein